MKEKKNMKKQQQSKYSKFFSYNKEVAQKLEAEKQEKNKKNGGKKNNGDKKPPNILKFQKGLRYSFVILPYIHDGLEDAEPIKEVAMHFRFFGQTFPCLYANALDEHCPADLYVKKLWDKHRHYKENKDEKSRKQTLELINNSKAQSRFYSPVWLKSVEDAETDKPAVEEFKKYANRIIWWSYPPSVEADIRKHFRKSGALHNPFNPALIDVEMVQQEGRRFAEQSIFVNMPTKEGQYAVVTDVERIDKMVEAVPDIFKSGIFPVLTSDQIKDLVRKNCKDITFGEDEEVSKDDEDDVVEPDDVFADDTPSSSSDEDDDGGDDGSEHFDEELDNIFASVPDGEEGDDDNDDDDDMPF